jgi:hypothetical protein
VHDTADNGHADEAGGAVLELKIDAKGSEITEE